MNWRDAFQYFIPLYVGTDGKTKPSGKTHGKGCKALSWEEAKEQKVFGAILKEGFIDISFDDAEMGKTFLKMYEAKKWNCVILVNPLNNHIHTIWKDSYNRITKKSGADLKTASGLIADIHGGYTVIRLREADHERFPPKYEINQVDEVPDELLIVSTKKNLWKQREGSGRNPELFGYIQILQTQLHFTNERCRNLIETINDFIFAEPLPQHEIETICRDEAFAKYEIQPLKVLNAAELLSMDLKPVYFAVEGLLPMGLSVIASPPKFGKSYLCTQLSIAVSNGEEFMGFKTNKSGVLYLALEDSFNRCKERLTQELQGKTPPKNLDIMVDCPTLGNGLIEQLQEYVSENPSTKLIIIDTFAKIRDGAIRNEGAYSADYRETGLVKKFADQNEIAVLLVHHTRKMKDLDDPFANISGTQGLTGACDTMLVLTKEKRSDALTKLSVTGRDIQQNEYGINRDEKTGIWERSEHSIDRLIAEQNEGLARYQYLHSNFRKTIMHLLNDSGLWVGRCGELLDSSRSAGYPITETAQKLAKTIDEYERFMIEEGIYHTEIRNGTGAKTHRFERSS